MFGKRLAAPFALAAMLAMTACGGGDEGEGESAIEGGDTTGMGAGATTTAPLPPAGTGTMDTTGMGAGGTMGGDTTGMTGGTTGDTTGGAAGGTQPSTGTP